jgi:hypothetical protein
MIRLSGLSVKSGMLHKKAAPANPWPPKQTFPTAFSYHFSRTLVVSEAINPFDSWHLSIYNEAPSGSIKTRICLKGHF